MFFTRISVSISNYSIVFDKCYVTKHNITLFLKFKQDIIKNVLASYSDEYCEIWQSLVNTVLTKKINIANKSFGIYFNGNRKIGLSLYQHELTSRLPSLFSKTQKHVLFNMKHNEQNNKLSYIVTLRIDGIMEEDIEKNKQRIITSINARKGISVFDYYISILQEHDGTMENYLVVDFKRINDAINNRYLNWKLDNTITNTTDNIEFCMSQVDADNDITLFEKSKNYPTDVTFLFA